MVFLSLPLPCCANLNTSSLVTGWWSCNRWENYCWSLFWCLSQAYSAGNLVCCKHQFWWVIMFLAIDAPSVSYRINTCLHWVPPCHQWIEVEYFLVEEPAVMSLKWIDPIQCTIWYTDKHRDCVEWPNILRVCVCFYIDIKLCTFLCEQINHSTSVKRARETSFRIKNLHIHRIHYIRYIG